jgi:hypothetical protein
MYKLVAFATDLSLTMPGESWRQSFVDAVQQLAEFDRSGYTRDESDFLGKAARHHLKRPDRLPSITKLLRLASIQAVDLIDFVNSPKECCSARMPNVSAAVGFQKRRRAHRRRAWSELKLLVEELLTTADDVLLPSKIRLLGTRGLAPSGLWQHWPGLARQYGAERSRRAALAKEQCYGRAFKAAVLRVRTLRDLGEAVEIRREGARLMQEHRLSKHQAERAIHAAMASHDMFARILRSAADTAAAMAVED